MNAIIYVILVVISILDYIINFSLLFTCSIFFYLVFEYLEQHLNEYKDLHPWVVGVASAITGLLLLETSIQFNNGVIVDIRNVIILISGFIGGPISIIVSSFLIGLFRIYLLGVSTTSIFAGLNTIILGLILSLLMKWKPISYRNMHYYLLYTILQIGIGIAFLDNNQNSRLSGIFILVVTSIPAFYTTLFVLHLIKKYFERIYIIERLAEIDYLTKLPNIRKFKNIIEEYIDHNENFTLLLIDIDNFRNVNSTYGHLIGDEILKQIGQYLKQFTLEHEGTTTARISGEEFYVSCKKVAPAFGLYYAHEISKLISQNPFFVSNEHKIPITVSIGIVNFPDNGKSISELASAADKALMKANLQGKKQIVHYNHLHT
ncbi:diguanylate cyclase [Rummeliibacillus pycnus]|uniref:diguanylate cyclase n=1 Tax=Rummeliibacillus pycnus TaxID=101070 RepID=UPI000C9BE362|nr:diguanylate cyclase [Rummeliibacillus pycnus]